MKFVPPYYLRNTDILFSSDRKAGSNICGGVLMRSPPNRKYVQKDSRRKMIKALFFSPLAAFFSPRNRAKADAAIDTRFRCYANCRHYVPHHNLMMLDGPPSGYCKHPERVGERYLCDATSVVEAGLYRRPGDGCDDLFEGNVREKGLDFLRRSWLKKWEHPNSRSAVWNPHLTKATP